MTNTTTYTPEGLIDGEWREAGYRVVARVHYADGTSRAVTLPRPYDSAETALLACVMLTVNDQQIEASRKAEIARLSK